MDIKQELEKLQFGESFNTTAKRTGIYVVAKRLGISIKTDKISDDETRVTRVQVKSVERSTLERVRDLSIADRLRLFEQFELCCGYNRGSCICEPEPIEIAAPVAVSAAVLDSSGMNDAMARFLANAQPVAAEPIEDDWRFNNEKPQFDEQTSNIYRKQVLYPAGKRTRTVQVDEDDHEHILRVMK